MTKSNKRVTPTDKITFVGKSSVHQNISQRGKRSNLKRVLLENIKTFLSFLTIHMVVVPPCKG